MGMDHRDVLVYDRISLPGFFCNISSWEHVVMIQEFLAVTLLAASAGYICTRIVRVFAPKKKGCGCGGCGCAEKRKQPSQIHT